MSTGRPRAELMEKIIRDFKPEAPGRRKNSASRTNAAATTIRCLEEKCFTAPLLKIQGTHLHLTNWSVRFHRVSSKKCKTTLPRNKTRSPHPVLRYWLSGVSNDQ